MGEYSTKSVRGVGVIRIFSWKSRKNKKFWGIYPVLGDILPILKGFFGKKRKKIPFDWQVGPRKYKDLLIE